MDPKYNNKDTFHFFLIYIIAIVTVYLLPDTFAYIFFFLLLILFWKSKKNAFWFALIFFMVDPPGDLFPNDYNYGLPFIKIANIRFQELFIYVAFIKALKQGKKFESIYKNIFIALLVTASILFIYSILIGTPISSIIISIKWVFIWSLIYSTTILISNLAEWLYFFKISFIITFIAFGSQILYLILGHPPAYLLGTNFNPMMDYGVVNLVEFETSNYNNLEARPISCSFIVLTSFIGAMFFLQNKLQHFNKRYLYSIIITAFVSIFLTATRGWFIGFSLALLLYIIIFQSFNKLINFILILIVILPLLFKISVFEKQLSGAFNRLLSIEDVLKGDISAKGSNARGEYSAKLIALWKESPVFGWGFSETFKDNTNLHAGHANLLFHVGILGFLVFIIFWYKLFVIPLQKNKLLSNKNIYKKALTIFTIGFIVFFIIHSTSGQVFGFYINFGMGTFGQIFFYCYSSYFIIESNRFENKINSYEYSI